MKDKITLHPAPITELEFTDVKEDDSGKYVEAFITNKETKQVESSFFLDKDLAEDIIRVLTKLITDLT